MQRVTLTLLSLLFVACGAATAWAQDKYPSKPIRAVVPFGAGSATDITIRIVGEQFRQVTGHGFMVENKPGAFGTLAIEEMVRRRPTATRSRSATPAPTCCRRSSTGASSSSTTTAR